MGKNKAPIYIVPFAHLDLFWAGSREECLSRGNEIILAALRMLKKYPEYRFMIEAANFIDYFCDTCPAEGEELKEFIRCGRVEAVPLRSIIYTHLPSGETLIRNCIAGRRVLQERFGSFGKIATLSDIPGVSPQLPQIAAKCGFEGILLSHGTPPHTDCVIYAAPDGTEIPAYAPIHYGRARRLFKDAADYEAMCENEPQLEKELGGVDDPQLCQFGVDLIVYDDYVVENFRRWNEGDHRPVRFTTLSDFFREEFSAKRKLSGEIPSLWPNVESSWPDLWPADLAAENALFNAEFFGALSPASRKEPLMREAWNWLLDAMDHNQNGIGGDIADQEKKDLKQSARMVAERLAKESAIRLAAKVTTPAENAFPIVIFNRLSWRRRELVRARTAIFGPREMKSGILKENNFRLIDPAGKELPFHLVKHLRRFGDSIELEFTADVPAYGAACYFIQVAEPAVFEVPFTVEDYREQEKISPNGYAGKIRFSNAFWQVEVDGVTGELNLSDGSGKLLIEHAGIVGIEEKRGDYICKMDLTGRRFPAAIDRISEVRINPVFAEIKIAGTVSGVPCDSRVRIFAGTPELEIENKLHWPGGHFVRLEQTFPLPGEKEPEIRYGVPFGMVRYPETIYKDGLDFNTIVTPERGNDPDDQIKRIRLASPFVSTESLTIGCDHRMWEFDGRELRSCMLRGIGWCSGSTEVLADGTSKALPRPPAGDYCCRYHLTAGGTEPKTGYTLNAPLYPVGVARSVPGTGKLVLPELPDTTGTTIIGNCVKMPETGPGMVLRLFESSGKAAELPLPAGEWFETDMIEGQPVPVSGTIRFKPFEIKTLWRKQEKKT